MTLEAARLKCKEYGQEHVLKYYDELSAEQQEALLAQIDETDMSILEKCKNIEELAKKGVITPLASMELSEIEANKESFTATGIQAIK